VNASIRPPELGVDGLPAELREQIQRALVEPLRRFHGAVGTALGAAWLVGDRLQLFEVWVDVPADWQTPTWQNSWTAATSISGEVGAAYRKTEDGFLELRGAADAPGGGPLAGDVLFAVPAAYVPAARWRSIQWTIDGTLAYNFAVVSIESSGAVTWIGGNTGASQAVGLQMRVQCADTRPPVFTTPYCLPQDLPYALARPPVGLWVLSIVERTTSTVILAPGGVDWLAVGNIVRLRHVTGLQAGKSYIIRLVALGG